MGSKNYDRRTFLQPALAAWPANLRPRKSSGIRDGPGGERVYRAEPSRGFGRAEVFLQPVQPLALQNGKEIEMTTPSLETIRKYSRRTPVEKKSEKVYESQSPARRRERYLKWKAAQPDTANKRRYDRINVKELFAEIAEILGISEAAARGRYYRKQLE